MTGEPLTVKELSAYLKRSPSATYELIHTGEIPHLRIGRAIRVPKSEVEKWLSGLVAVSKKKEDTHIHSTRTNEYRRICDTHIEKARLGA